MARSAIFVDRDDTLIEDVGYCKDPDCVRLMPGAANGLAKLERAGYSLVVVTNQSGIARGYFTRDDLAAVHARLQSELEIAGVRLDAIYYCPHLPEEGCECRKPRPGLLLQAAAEMNLDLKNSFMIGDRELDLLAGKAAGTFTILVTDLDSPERNKTQQADFVVKDLEEAAASVLAKTGNRTMDTTKASES